MRSRRRRRRGIPGLVIALSVGLGASLGMLWPKAAAVVPQTVGTVASSLPRVFRQPRPMTILVMGVDYNNYRRTGLTTEGNRTRTDTLLVVRVDPNKKRAAVLSIPRDSRVVMPGVGVDKINAANVYGDIPLVKATVENLLGITIDRTVRFNLEGARQLIDLVGGVDLEVEKSLHYDDWAGKLHVHLEPGKHHLNGEQAVGYARFRHDHQGDIGRVQRQQRLFAALKQKLQSPLTLLRAPQIVGLASTHLETDLTTDELLDFATWVPNVKDLVVASLPGDYTMIEGVSYWEISTHKLPSVIDKFLDQSKGGERLEAQIEILNATGDAHAPDELVERLTLAGYTIARVQPVSPRYQAYYPDTKLIDRTEAPSYTVDRLIEMIGPAQLVVSQPEPVPFVGDYVIILGKDWKGPPGPRLLLEDGG